MSVLKHLVRRKKFGSGGVGMSDPRVHIPENTPSALSSTLDQGDSSGRVYHPLDQADYYTYGQKGGEHQFFTGNLPVSPLKPNNFPTTPTGGSGSGGGGAAGVLNDIVGLAGTAKTAGQLANMAGIDNQYTQAMQNPIGAIKDAYGNYQLNNDVGSGHYANSAVSDANLAPTALGAAGAASALGTGTGLTASITPELIGAGEGAIGATTGAGAAGAGAAGGAGASSGLGATLASSGAATALPIAAIGWAAADAINNSMGVGEKGRLSGAWSDAVGGTPTFYGKLQTGYELPDGTHVTNLQAQALSTAWKNGDQETYSRLLSELKGGGHARGGRSFVTGPPGALAYATQDPKYVGTVKGRGTGRSDEIPARLSDGEYVMDAETVSMLGDGSTDAGAKKLDQLRANLRKHKGKNLSKGKFSDNAKNPAEYMK